MKSADYVSAQIAQMQKDGLPPAEVAWKTALLTVGWAYVFGARGQACTPANRRAAYRVDHPTIKTKCQNFKGKKSCSGCKWYPGGERTRVFDCRGFTYWILLKAYDWQLQGAGATSQWNTASNWTAKGTIDTVPADKLVCLFQKSKVKKGSMAHTGLSYNGETVECSVGVQHNKQIDKKWTHWGLPKCVDGVPPAPEPPKPKPDPQPKKKTTIRKGSKGAYVKECQEDLISLGYDVGKTGADGKFGRCTQKAVKAFQKAAGLKADGIVGPLTWDALEKRKGGVADA